MLIIYPARAAISRNTTARTAHLIQRRFFFLFPIRLTRSSAIFSPSSFYLALFRQNKNSISYGFAERNFPFRVHDFYKKSLQFDPITQIFPNQMSAFVNFVGKKQPLPQGFPLPPQYQCAKDAHNLRQSDAQCSDRVPYTGPLLFFLYCIPEKRNMQQLESRNHK